MLTHFNKDGRAKMVNVSDKANTTRNAIASGKIYMRKETLELIKSGGHKKGDVLAVAQVAGVMAAKKTSDIIPMCHPIMISGVDISFSLGDNFVEIISSVSCNGQTGVEMEALSAVSVSALTIYDMCKAVDKDMKITDICLLEKSGGKSGVYRREE
ncbi:cyclic pyranopterin monophosphate synthase MoaC [Mycoplasmatota bacterium]|nr:cyclic pyranopterin monophosphate synthase MoaC [Mycoplasmatota bacterium]